MYDFELQDRSAYRMVDGIHDRLNQPDQLLDVLVDELHDYERDVFSSNGNGNGDWAALSPNTLRQKSGSRVLYDSGDLFDQLTSNRDVAGDEATITTDLPYARLLKAGTGRMPGRDPAPEPPSSVVDHLAESLLDAIVGHW